MITIATAATSDDMYYSKCGATKSLSTPENAMMHKAAFLHLSCARLKYACRIRAQPGRRLAVTEAAGADASKANQACDTHTHCLALYMKAGSCPRSVLRCVPLLFEQHKAVY